jgi:uncharacterized membrane protein YeiH
MEKLLSFFYFLDLAGAFVFAISGATAARERGLDIFGICVIAFTVACGGGIIRDVCIGAIPPAGLSNWRYLVTSVIATGLTIGMFQLVQKMARPVLFFDAIGLSLFAVAGAEKALLYNHNGLVAVLLGVTTAVGGGVLRDILLNRVPVILEKEVYALAALIGASLVVIFRLTNWVPGEWVSIIAIATCFTIRILALQFHWNLPTAPEIKKKDG